jgi:DNA recombination protein RmuC
MNLLLIAVPAALAFCLGALLVWLAMRAPYARLEERCSSAERHAIEAGDRGSEAVDALIERTKNELREATVRSAGERVEAVVTPLRERLAEFDAAVRDVEKQRIGQHEGLKEQISGLLARTEHLENAANALRSQTSSLATALRDPRARGRWGEIQLRRVLELAGMLDYCDFAEQQTVLLDDGRGRPDVTVNLPGGKRIFVDAKVPLDRFIEASETSDDAVRATLLREHARLVRDHAIALGRRGYTQANGSAELVAMFVPGEGSLSAALHENPSLFEEALDHGVLVASPLTLIAILRSYALGWQAVHQEENAKRIAEVARDLYEAVRVFADHLERVGDSLGRSLESYNKAVGSLERNVLPKGRKLKELGSFGEDDLAAAEPLVLEPRPITAAELRPNSDS